MNKYECFFDIVQHKGCRTKIKVEIVINTYFQYGSLVIGLIIGIEEVNPLLYVGKRL